ncbi:BTB domain-containing protein [Favolaschia claudopus]|uniref:BTB domain-containing protein n=1 Tax=Favolaschia claudopus TaxID=2862362 RepID=A0AAW0CBP7_9AGAR
MSSSTSLPPPLIPDKPFNDPNADVILTSSDGADFRVQRASLTLLSPVFEDLFRLPQPPNDPAVPSIPMAESADTLDLVLRFCYPGAERKIPDNIDQLRQVLEVSLLKYDIQSIVPKAKKFVSDYLASNPIAVYAIACCYEWKELAVSAARCSLDPPLRSFPSNSAFELSELESLSATHYHRLLQYHAACAAACLDSIEMKRWITAPPQDVWFTCKNAECSTNPDWMWYLSDGQLWLVRDWFLAYMKAVRDVLEARPSARVDDPQLMVEAMKQMVKCSNCRQNGFEQLQNFATKTFASRIREVVDKVKLDLPFA